MPEDLTSALLMLVDSLREDGRTSLETFILNGHRGLGGTLVIQAPCAAVKRPRYEAGFRSERFRSITEG